MFSTWSYVVAFAPGGQHNEVKSVRFSGREVLDGRRCDWMGFSVNPRNGAKHMRCKEIWNFVEARIRVKWAQKRGAELAFAV